MKCWEAESKAARALPSHLSSLNQYISTPRPVACESESERQVSKHLAACCGKHFSDRVVQLVVREQSKIKNNLCLSLRQTISVVQG